jgi:CheY-like chemotaxis protein
MGGGDMLERAGGVVVIDDEADWREIVVQCLSEKGFDAVGFADARDALAVLRGRERLPAAILLDLEMPGMTGWEFRREQLRDPRLASIPVVVASGAEARGIEADAFLAKPYLVGDLCRVLAAMELRAVAA